MITPQQQAQVDAIKAKYKFTSPQQQAAPKQDWFTATAPKEKLPFAMNDMENPQRESARTTAGNTLKKTGGEILDAAKGGVEQIKEGFNDANNIKAPTDAKSFVEGAGNFVKSGLKMGAGAVNTAFSPLAPAFKPVGDVIQKAGDALESTYGSAVERGLAEQGPTPIESGLTDVVNATTIAGAVAAPKASGKIADAAGAGAQKTLDITGKGLSKVKEVLPERPHPIDALRGYADTKVKASMQSDVDKLLKSTKTLARKTEEAGARGTDFNKILSDPQVYKGLKVENGKINPDEAITTVDDRIDSILTAKKGILPKVDEIVPKTPKQVLENRAIEYLKGKELPADEVGTIKRLQAQMDALPDQLTTVQMDALRAMARKGARDAKGQMKSSSEYAALEIAARDTVFDITDNLPVPEAAQYKALNDYVKSMISTKELLDGPLRSQVVKGGRLGSYSGRAIGAIAGVSGGPLGTIAASYAGGVIADIITNNSLGSSFKMSLIRNLTDDPAILAQAQRLLKDIQEHQVPQLPPGRGNPSDVKINTPIEMGPSSTVEPAAQQTGPQSSYNPVDKSYYTKGKMGGDPVKVESQSALGNNQRMNDTPAQTETISPINQSMPESIPETTPKSIPKVNGGIPETSHIIKQATEYQPEFAKAVDEIAKAGDWEVHHGPVKKEDRATAKVEGEGSVLRDANRSTIIVKDPSQLASVAEAVKGQFPDITRLKDKFQYDGYKSAIINVMTPLGHEAEIAVTTPAMWAAKMERGGQKMYNAVRDKVSGWEKVEKKMLKLYKAAASEDGL